MTPAEIVAPIGGVLAAAGLVMIVCWIRGLRPSRRIGRVASSGQVTRRRSRLIKAAAAASAGLLAWLITGWPVMAVAVAAGVIGLPAVFLVGREAQRQITRLQALEEWLRRLADSLAAGGAPVATIVRSAARAPDPIRAEVTQLATRLSTARWDRHTALLQFADRLDDAQADEVVNALDITISAHGSTSNLPLVLREVAKAVAKEVEARRQSEVQRASPRGEALVLVGLIVVAITLMLTLDIFGVAQVYATPTGQGVLAVLFTAAAAALYMVRRLSLTERRPRLLTSSRRERS